MASYWKVRMSFVEVSINVCVGFVWFVSFFFFSCMFSFGFGVVGWRQDSGLETVRLILTF